jgi:hypothetical protein
MWYVTMNPNGRFYGSRGNRLAIDLAGVEKILAL